jgi:uncharacterized protein YrrD
MIEDLRIGAAVASTAGDRLGTLSRVVVDGTTDTVAGIVVDPGLVQSGNLLAPGGWSRPRERVVPTQLVAAVTAEEVRLSCDEDAFAQLPLFEHEQSVAVDPTTAGAPERWSRFRLGDLINYAASEFGLGGAPYLPPAEITHVEPPTAGAIAEGTLVWRTAPHERIGEVERVLADAATQRVSSLVIRRGGLARHRVVLPAAAIASVEDGVIHVHLTDAELETLAPYEPDAEG